MVYEGMTFNNFCSLYSTVTRFICENEKAHLALVQYKNTNGKTGYAVIGLCDGMGKTDQYITLIASDTVDDLWEFLFEKAWKK